VRAWMALAAAVTYGRRTAATRHAQAFHCRASGKQNATTDGAGSTRQAWWRGKGMNSNARAAEQGKTLIARRRGVNAPTRAAGGAGGGASSIALLALRGQRGGRAPANYSLRRAAPAFAGAAASRQAASPNAAAVCAGAGGDACLRRAACLRHSSAWILALWQGRRWRRCISPCAYMWRACWAVGIHALSVVIRTSVRIFQPGDHLAGDSNPISQPRQTRRFAISHRSGGQWTEEGMQRISLALVSSHAGINAPVNGRDIFDAYSSRRHRFPKGIRVAGAFLSPRHMAQMVGLCARQRHGFPGRRMA